MDEVRLVVQKGYRILKIFEYKVTRYDPETREGGYIDRFLKLKVEASG